MKILLVFEVSHIYFIHIFPANVRITVDGGTSKWDNYVRNLPHEMQTNMKRPDLVTGDFDSITEDTLEKYKKQGCEVKFLFILCLLHYNNYIHTLFHIITLQIKILLEMLSLTHAISLQ